MADRNVRVTVSARVSDFNRGMAEARRAVRGLHDEIDKTNDRTAWLAQSVLALTPAFTTLGAGAVPVISGLATQLVLTGAAAGTMALAFNGVGDSLDALNDYQLDPTAENLEKLNDALAKIGPEGEEFVRYLDSLGPSFSNLANIARAGIFPGVTDGIQEFMTLMPRLQGVIRETAEAVGELAGDAGAGLSGSRWESFFEYLETDGKQILLEMGRTLGNFITGLANMMVAFGPLTADFSAGFEDMARSFADWSTSLSTSNGFGEFVDYVREAGPLALDFLASASMAFVELIEAAAPIGTIMLPGLTMLVDVIGALADTPLGPLVLGFTALTSAWGRLNAVAAITGSGAMAKATAGIRSNVAAANMLRPSLREAGTSMLYAAHSQDVLRTSMASGSKIARDSAKNALLAKTQVTAFGRAAAPVAGQLALLGAAGTGLASSFGLSNTATLGLAGSLVGPWGAAAGATVGLLMDMKSAGEQASTAFDQLGKSLEENKLDNLTAELEAAKKEFEDLNELTGVGDFFSDALADVAASGTGSLEEVYAARVAAAEEALAGFKAAQNDAAGDKTYYNSLQAETQALEENINKMRAKREEALRGFSAETNYAQAILDAKEAFKENGATLDLNTEAGLNNRRALEGIASAFNDLTDKQKNAKGAAKQARDTLYDQAIQFGATKEQARRYVRTLLEIPTKATTRIILENDLAARKLAGLRAQLASITANPFYINIGVRAPNLSGFGPQIDYDTGGYTGDGPKHEPRGVVHAGEVVVPQELVQRDWEFLSARYGHLPGFASGGLVGGASSQYDRRHATPAMSGAWAASAAAEIDYDRLIGGLAHEFRSAADEANEAIGRGIARESGRGWTQQSRQDRAASLGGRPT